ncbi:oxidoreductase [Granulicella cerasi]|uniref:Oxidoreductase n=1 Tax=Granulicella cerasi TaxID=741063 RepID=A0ABW1ZAC8_9BACT|nr:oxidoreductase [Granulicella cerasi]
MKWTAANIPSQTGKTAVVTGANSGIGYQAALELARAGAHVLLGARDVGKGDVAAAKIRAAVPNANVEVVALDMASLSSIHSFAESFAARGVALEILINNAGVMAIKDRELTVDGFEKQMGTNHLGHFALTGLLLPQLLYSRDESSPRVVTVASLAHRGGKIELDNLNAETGYTPWGAYNNSKLANILFARELHRRLQGRALSLKSLAVHPGVSKTNIFQNGLKGKDLKSLIMSSVGGFMMQDDAMGALPTLFAATAPEARGGQYIGPDGFMAFKGYPTVEQPKPQALDDDMARKLWEKSEELTGVKYHGL